MVGVHLYGFVKKNQPVIEHLEIAMYLILSLLAWYFYPQPPGWRRFGVNLIQGRTTWEGAEKESISG